jgi:hypothetical protein
MLTETLIFVQLREQLLSLQNLLALIDTSAYQFKNLFLGKVSIGQHTRHIIELLQCVHNGYESGQIDYNHRKRNLTLETDKEIAAEAISDLILNISKPNKTLQLSVEKVCEEDISFVMTNYFREIVYNTEHTIHHKALIKVALHEMNLNMVDENFGMAYSTMQYQKELKVELGKLTVKS